MPKIVQPDILHLEACNFIDKPMGGQLTFSRQLMAVLGSRLALVGWASNSAEPVGCWFDKEIEGTVYRYFAIGREKPSDSKPLIPARIITWFQIKRYLTQILSIGLSNVIVREHSILMALNRNEDCNLCYCFPGVEPPLTISRYPMASRLSALFDYLFFQSLDKKAKTILAAADEAAIVGLKNRAGERLNGKNIISFPTRVDTDIFHPLDRLSARRSLELPLDKTIAVTTGRIHWAKGWPFLLESFKLFHDQFPESLLVFLGDGVERALLEQRVVALGLQKSVIVAGYQTPIDVAAYLQASNLFVMGSLKEGWSTVLVEALACHLPIVTTRFSSAETIVQQGVNGYVVDTDPQEFSKAMASALSLPNVSDYVESVIDRYALVNLARDLFRVWPII